MAVTPLFNADIPTLKAKLRLSGATAADTDAMLLDTVKLVRVNLYDKLSASRISTLLSYPVSDNPSSDHELLREKAAQAESLWVRMIMFRRIPVLFMDSSGTTQQQWNDEGLTRNMGNKIAEELERMQLDLDLLIGDLLDDSNNSGSLNRVTVFEPDPCTTPRPGQSLRGNFGRNGFFR